MGLKSSNKDRDIILVEKALEGDQTAYTELMTLYWESIENLFSVKLPSKEDVEDLTIATFSKAFDKLDLYNSSFAFSTWLQTIATNTLIDFFRKKHNKTLSLDQEKEVEGSSSSEMQLIDSSLDPESSLIQKQKNKKINSMVHLLKPHYRELIILRYLDEMSYNEISEKLSIPIGTVKAKLFRARDLLMQILKTNENEY